MVGREFGAGLAGWAGQQGWLAWLAGCRGGTFSRERLAKGSCLVGLPLGASCPSRGVAARVAAALRARCRRIEILNFPKENQGFRAWAGARA